MSVTHVAGPVVTVAGRIIQRCAVCGEKLLDNLNQAVELNADGSVPTYPAWAEAALVQVAGEQPQRSSVVGDFVKCERLPEDFCLALVE